MFTTYMSRKSSEKGGNILYKEIKSQDYSYINRIMESPKNPLGVGTSFFSVILRIYLLQEDFSGLALLFHPMP